MVGMGGVAVGGSRNGSGKGSGYEWGISCGREGEIRGEDSLFRPKNLFLLEVYVNSRFRRPVFRRRTFRTRILLPRGRTVFVDPFPQRNVPIVIGFGDPGGGGHLCLQIMGYGGQLFGMSGECGLQGSLWQEQIEPNQRREAGVIECCAFSPPGGYAYYCKLLVR